MNDQYCTSGDLSKALVGDVLDYVKLESGNAEVDIKETMSEKVSIHFFSKARNFVDLSF